MDAKPVVGIPSGHHSLLTRWCCSCNPACTLWIGRSSDKNQVLFGDFCPPVEILLDVILPVLVQGYAAPDGGPGMSHHFVVEAGALAVAEVVHRSVGGDAQIARCFYRVDVDTQGEKFPAILLLLALEHLFDLLGRIVEASVLHDVDGDDEHGVLRHILEPGVLVAVADVVDGPADGIHQGGVAPDIVLLVGDGLDVAHLHPVAEHLGLVIKENIGDKSLSFSLFSPNRPSAKM